MEILIPLVSAITFGLVCLGFGTALGMLLLHLKTMEDD